MTKHLRPLLLIVFLQLFITCLLPAQQYVFPGEKYTMYHADWSFWCEFGANVSKRTVLTNIPGATITPKAYSFPAASYFFPLKVSFTASAQKGQYYYAIGSENSSSGGHNYTVYVVDSIPGYLTLGNDKHFAVPIGEEKYFPGIFTISNFPRTRLAFSFDPSNDDTCRITFAEKMSYDIVMYPDSGFVAPDLTTFELSPGESRNLGVTVQKSFKKGKHHFYARLQENGPEPVDLVSRGGYSQAIYYEFFVTYTSSIDMGNIANTSLCPGADFSVPFTTVGTFEGGNSFKVELSDENGSFDNAKVIGTLSAITGGTIPATLPDDLPEYSNYAIRVISTAPADTSEFFNQLSIRDSYPATVYIEPEGPSCADTVIVYKASLYGTYALPPYTASYQWLLNEKSVGENKPEYSNPLLKTYDLLDCKVTTQSICPIDIESQPLILQIDSAVLPAIEIAAYPGDTICDASDHVWYYVTYLDGEGDDPQIEWFKNGVSTGVLDDEFYDENPQHGDSVYAVLTSNLSCAVEPVAESNAIVLVKDSAVTPEVVIASTGSLSLCAGSSRVFYTTYRHGGDEPHFQWLKNGNPVGYDEDQYYDESLQPGDRIELEMTSDLPCAEPKPVTSNLLTVYGVSSVTPFLQIEALTGTTVCPYTRMEFEATLVDAGDNPVIQWYRNGLPVGDGTRWYYLSNPVNGDMVYAMVDGQPACGPAVKVSSNIVTITVPQSMPASVSIRALVAGDGCGLAPRFQATVVNGGFNPVYQWKRNGVRIGGNSAILSSNTLKTGDVITCTVMSSFVCATPRIVNSNSITVQAGGFVNPSISISSSSCSDTVVSFRASITNQGQSPTLQWYINRVKVTGATGLNFTTRNFKPNDTITCQLTSSLVCASPKTVSSNQIVINPVYTFTGSGNWNVAANWLNKAIPPAVLPSCARIIIDPVAGTECVLNTSQAVAARASIIVKQGKKFRITGNLSIGQSPGAKGSFE